MNANKAIYCKTICKNCIKIRKNYKVQKDIKTRQKFYFRLEKKKNNISSKMLLDHCYALGCHCSLPVWRRSFLKKGTPVIYFCPALDPPLGGSGWKRITLVRDHEFFIPTKFHYKNPSSGSGEEVENVKSLRRTDGRKTKRYDNSSLEPSAQVS